MQPHSKEKYINRFNESLKYIKSDFRRKDYFTIRREGYLITGVRPIEAGKPELGFQGEVVRFLKFDPKDADQWIKLSEGKPAKKDDVQAVNVPADLKPNMGIFRFAFFPDSHRLTFETRSDGRALSHKSALAVFSHFFNHPSYSDDAPHVRLNIENSHQMMARILKLDEISLFDLRLFRPNDLITAEDEEEAIKEMSDAGVEQIEIKLQRTAEKPIKLWDWVKRLAAWTPSNGSVSAKGIENGKKVTLSTEDKPVTKKPRFDTRITTASDAFLTESEKYSAELKK